MKYISAPSPKREECDVSSGSQINNAPFVRHAPRDHVAFVRHAPHDSVAPFDSVTPHDCGERTRHDPQDRST
jgi:hypothetical protein